MLGPLPRRAGVHFRVEQVTGVGPTRSLNGAQFEAMKPNQTLDIVISFVWRYKRLLGVGRFLGVLLTVFEVSGLRDHFNLAFIQQLILQHRIGGLMLFVLLFSLGNLIQIPGWVFLAAAVLTLGRVWGGAVTYFAAFPSCAFTFVMIQALGGYGFGLLKNRGWVPWLPELACHTTGVVERVRILPRSTPASK